MIELAQLRTLRRACVAEGSGADWVVPLIDALISAMNTAELFADKWKAAEQLRAIAERQSTGEIEAQLAAMRLAWLAFDTLVPPVLAIIGNAPILSPSVHADLVKGERQMYAAMVALKPFVGPKND